MEVSSWIVFIAVWTLQAIWLRKMQIAGVQRHVVGFAAGFLGFLTFRFVAKAFMHS